MARPSPLDIYALLDKSNCKDCGYDTCMAFATDLLERKITMPKMKKGKKVLFVCQECGKEMPVDKEKSNENWKAYKEKCSCGGKGEYEIKNEKTS